MAYVSGTLVWGSFWDSVNYTVFKTPSAVASNYLGGGTVEIKVRADYYKSIGWSQLDEAQWDVYLYVNGKEVYLGQCYKSQYNLGFKEYNWTEYKMPNASAVFHTCGYVNITDANGNTRSAIMKKVTILYENKDGSFGYRTHTVITNNTEGCPKGGFMKMSVYQTNTNTEYTINQDALWLALNTGVLTQRDRAVLRKFVNWAKSQGFEWFLAHLAAAFFSPTDIELNVKRIAVNRTSLVPIGYATKYDPNTRSFSFYIGAMDMFALGAVLATSVMPLPYDLPKVVKPVGNTTSVIT
jgi:hypothetical protein